MASPHNCPQSSNCLIHCFSMAGRFVLSQMLCPVRLAGNFAYLNVPQNGGTNCIALVLFVANFLSMEKAKHERIAERVVTEAIIDLPRCYNDERHRSILNSAAATIGVRIRKFLDRPISAALSYSPFLPHVRNVLVFEFGSGVLCSSLLEIQRGNRGITVVASDHSLGCPLVHFMGEEINEVLGIEIQENGSAFRGVNEACEQAKNALGSGQPCGVVDLSFLQGRHGVQMPPQVVDLAQLTHLNLHWIRTNINQCLFQAGEASCDAVDEVILVGVSVGIPDVRRTLVSMFPGRPLRDELDPGTFVRDRALDMAALCHNETMVVSADHIERMWPRL